jgi:uncharacterized protein with HEPN domain
MQRHDRIRLQHMLDAANEALEFVRGKRRSDLDTDRKLVLSLVKELEIIGEAVGKISRDPNPIRFYSLAGHQWNAQSLDPRLFRY